MIPPASPKVAAEDPSPRQGALKIVVAALTRRRPRMLEALLRSLGAMRLPEGADVAVLVVENDDAAACAPVVAAMRPLPNGADLLHVHEPELGIPFGRNRAAREAVARGTDLLLFVDDDEVVTEDWLVRFVTGYRASRARLMGAPLRVLDTGEALSPYRRMLHRGVAARYRRKEGRAAARASLDATPGVTIVTNNWLGETSLFTEDGLWFDEAMRFTGGTDAKFYAEAKAAGIPTGWVADAPVYEEIPMQRLSLRYQFARGRDQAAAHLARKIGQDGTASRGKAAALLLLRALMLPILAGLAPFRGGSGAVDLARQAGAVAGQVGALLGRRSTLYETVTGR